MENSQTLGVRQMEIVNGQMALVDEDVYEWAKDYRWLVHGSGIYRRDPPSGKPFRKVYLHREILGHTLNTKIIRLNNDLLDNRRENLRTLVRATDEKKCGDCKLILPASSFYARTRAGKKYLESYCKTCWDKRTRETHQKHKPKILASRRKKNKDLRFEALRHYSNGLFACCCPGCRCTWIEFLVIDHINNDGAKHRKEIGSTTIFKWLKWNNYPPGFQVLCHNCNASKGIHGECSHVWFTRMLEETPAPDEDD